MEIAIVLIIALVVFGPKRLPELGKSLGKGLSGFKDGMSGIGPDEDKETTPSASNVVSEAPESGRQVPGETESQHDSSEKPERAGT